MFAASLLYSDVFLFVDIHYILEKVQNGIYE